MNRGGTGMIGSLFAILVSILLPLTVFVYSCLKKNYTVFLIGAMTFVASQMVLRLPLLSLLEKYSTNYLFFSATKPILYAVFLGITAALFEEMARYVAILYLLKSKTWGKGVLFGLGHGGIEAIIFVGLPVLSALISMPELINNGHMFISGVERLFAIFIHIGFSVMVMQGVVKQKFRFVVIAFIIHTIIDASIGIIPQFTPVPHSLFVTEGLIFVAGIALLIYCLVVRRKGILK